MSMPWYEPNLWGWLPGTAIGCVAGLWGALAGFCVPFGRARITVIGMGVVLAAVSGFCLIAGITALSVGQPYGVWYGLLLPGVVCTPLFIMGLRTIVRGYRLAGEQRRQAGPSNV